MLENFPLVSIMIPTYNRAERLRRAVESALNQNYPRIEILISDNASNDATNSYLRLITDDKVKSFRQRENIGLIGNWNFLLNKANGAYCLMLSDDDELYSDAVKNLMVAVLMANNNHHSSNINIILGSSKISKDINNTSGSITLLNCNELMRGIIKNKIQAFPSAMLLKTDMAKKNGYRNYYETAIDLGLIADFSKNKGNAIILDGVVCKYNLHADNITAKFDVDKIYKTYRRLLRVVFGVD